jgi:FkbM family methyltransferase
MNLRKYLRNGLFADIYRYFREWSYLIRRKHKTPYGFFFIGNKKMITGEFEEDIVSFIQLVSRKGYELFIDVGAHHGYFTCLANSLGLKTISIEPDPINYRILKRNLSINLFRDEGLTYQLGIGERQGRKKFYGFSTGVSVFRNWSQNVSRRSFEVEIKTLDQLVSANLQSSSFILKIDVEGCEEDVLKGAKNILNLQIPIWVICEITFNVSDMKAKENGWKSSRVFSLMREYGFDTYEISKDGSIREFPFNFSGYEGVISANFLFKNRIIAKSPNM